MDLTAVGKRVADLRQARGWSQKRLARAIGVDNSYISRIERGQREPRGPVLARIADALGCTREHLVHGASWPGDPRAIDLDLNFAELALRSGDAQVAHDRYAALLELARSTLDHNRVAASLLGLALALESLGKVHEAVEALDELANLPSLPPTVSRTYVLMLLCRTSMQCGDMGRAIELGEVSLREAGWGTGPVPEAVIELASTLVFCYYERGDLARAQGLVKKVLTQAEAHGSVRARASAYWNAGLVAQGKGDIEAAVRFTERALALFGELENRWATATLRRNAGWLMLQLPDPPHPEIRAVLAQALVDLHEVGSPSEISEAEADLAHLHVDLGEWREALRFARSAVARTADGPTLEAAKARLALADVLAAMGDTEAALSTYRDAAQDFEASSAARYAATAWRRVAQLLVDLGRHEEANEAYARLADASGIPGLASVSRRMRGPSSSVLAATGQRLRRG